MAVDLDFKGTWSPPSGGNVPLDFGRSHSDPPTADHATIRLRLGPPAVRVQAVYLNQVSRKLEGSGQLRWQQAAWQAGKNGDGWGSSQRDRSTTAAPWQLGFPAVEEVDLVSGDNVRSRQECRLPWLGASRVAGATAGRFAPLATQHSQLGLPWQEGTHLTGVTLSPFVWLLPLHHHQIQPWQLGTPQQRHQRFRFEHGHWTSKSWMLPWQIGCLPLVGESHLPVDPPALPPEPKRNPNLDFLCPASQQGLAWRPALLLDFGTHPCPQSGFTVPILKVYFVSNSVDVVRLPGREPISVKSFQVSIDADSWAWGFSASLPYSALELIEPTSTGPVEIEATVNGVSWVLLVEGFELHRQFGQSSLEIRGRSTVAYLAEPYAPKRSFVPASPFTARQLAEQELVRPGLATGFNLNWQLPDWLVPAGSWGYQSLSPMGVIGRIVESVGGYVNAHPRLKTLVAKPRYPELPWNWSTLPAQRSLPLNVVKTLNLRWQEKPAFNAVYVSGERQGLIGHVVRAGTAGDAVAPMVIDDLITHADAARERGRAVLSNVGKQAVVTLELPMLASIGLLDPGLLVAVGEGSMNWQGLVRATSIVADWNESLTVRQTIEVERHYL